MFCLQLSGKNEDYWKLMQLIRKLFYSGPSNELLDLTKYRIKIKALYPDREVDMYDRIELEFISYCGNKLSNEAVMDQTCQMMLRGIDPNFQLVRNGLNE